MSDLIQNPSRTEHAAKKLKEIIQQVSESNRDELDINSIAGKLQVAFRSYFDSISDISFSPKYLIKGNIVESKTYNDNLREINEDLERFYEELESLATIQANSFNYSQIVAEQILNRADSLASIVLDLNIINNFTRGDVIVAGDDFRNTDFIDLAAGTASPTAELLNGGGGIGLARDDSRELLNPGTEVEVFPLAPATNGGETNQEPTKGNIERFYEGNYYNFLGQARPEGGRFNFKYILKPETPPDEEEENLSELPETGEEAENFQGVEDNSQNVADGYFVDFGATEDQKKVRRGLMFDKDPVTFWECEYNYKAPSPLIGDIFDQIEVFEEEVDEGEELQFDSSPEGAAVTIDLGAAERAAQQFDTAGRDLIVDMIIKFPQLTNVNFVSINPVLFGENAFISVEDISTSSEEDGDFETVDGWERIRFPKTITPEANEFLTDTQIGASLAPSRFAYKGQGIYPFPVRQAKRVKIRIKSELPVAPPYERVVALLRRTIDIEGTITTKTKRGLLA